MARLTIKETTRILADSFSDFKRNDPLRLAGATAFFTTFALPPILIILVQVMGVVFQVKNLREEFFGHLTEILGSQSAGQIRQTFLGFKSLATNWLIAAGGFVFLMFVATTLFKVIKDSINQLWEVKPTGGKKKFKLQIESRIISLTIILFAGFLFIGGMLAEGLEAFLHQYTGTFHSDTADFLNVVFNQLLSIVIVTAWFAVLFKALPDAKTSWKVVMAGGLFTGILFSIGKNIIRYFLLKGNLTNIFGASTSIVLLLLFVFYSSFILYYGACFTKAYATFIHEPIRAALNAVKYKMVEVESD
jgi:membrane protein